MSSQTKTRILVALGLVLATILVFNISGGSPAAPGAAADEAYHPIALENPALHLDRIERLRKLEYKPTGRDIFTASLPPPPAPKVDPPYVPHTVPAPPPEPPLTVPFKFYGFSADPKTGAKRGFFTNGDEVFIAAEGEIVMNRYRIASIGNTAVDVEEVSSGKHAKLTLDAPGSGGAP